MKKMMMVALMIISINNVFASTSESVLGQDLGYKECTASIQDNRLQENLDDAKKQIIESEQSGSSQTDR